MRAIGSTSTKATRKNIQVVLEALAETPPALDALAAALGSKMLALPLEAGEWSPVEILAHLRACEEVNTSRLQAMLILNEPELPNIYPRQMQGLMELGRLDFGISLSVFKARRADLLHLLDGLDPAGWQRLGLIRGKAQNVYCMARGIAHHEAQHVAHWEQVTGLASAA